MLNTPPSYNWYLAGLVFKWMLAEGGVEEFARRNARQVAAAVCGHRRLRRLLSQRSGAGRAFAHERAVLPARRRADRGLPVAGEGRRADRAEGPSRARRHPRLDLQRDAGRRRACARRIHERVPATIMADRIQKKAAVEGTYADEEGSEERRREETDGHACRQAGEARPARRARADRRHRPPDPGPDRRARRCSRTRSARPRASSPRRSTTTGPSARRRCCAWWSTATTARSSDEVLVRLFREIMSACLAQQEPLKVGYLGPEGTFRQQAVHKHFGHSAKGLPLVEHRGSVRRSRSRQRRFRRGAGGELGAGHDPVTLDMFLTSPLKICGEVELRVHQYLLSRTGHIEDIERVYLASAVAGAVQGLAAREPAEGGEACRCRAMPRPRAARAMPTMPRRSPARTPAHVYGLKVIAGPDRGSQRQHHALPGASAARSFPPSGHDRTSVLVFIRDQPGALFNVLEPLARHGISMNRIESRPSHQARCGNTRSSSTSAAMSRNRR